MGKRKGKKTTAINDWDMMYLGELVQTRTTEKLFVYGIFLDEHNRERYGMTNPHYTTIPGYITVGHGIVQAVQVNNADIALTGLMVDMDSAKWPSLDALEGGYDRIKVKDDMGVEAWMYAEPEKWRQNGATD